MKQKENKIKFPFKTIYGYLLLDVEEVATRVKLGIASQDEKRFWKFAKYIFPIQF